MDVVQREMPPDVAQVTEVAEQLADDRLGLAAVGALEIAVLDDRHGRLRRPSDVVASGIDGIVQVDDHVRGSEQRPDPETLGKQRGRAEDEPGRQRGAQCRAEHAELRLLQLRSSEREAGDQQRDGEADAGDGAAARERGPADRRPQPAAAHSRHEPRAAQHAGRLSHDVPDQDPQRDRRAERAREEAAVDHDAGVRKGEEGHDHVARPGVIELLQPLVR